MKRKIMLMVIVNTVFVMSVVLVGMLHAGHSGADATPATLPSSISAQGSVNDEVTVDGVQGHSLYRSSLVQFTSQPWVLNLDYIPLNGNVSVTITDRSGLVLDSRLLATGIPGSLSMQEALPQPLYIYVSAASWSITAE